MKRWHLFELEDFAWYPSVIREGQTDYLRFMMELFDVFAPIIPKIKTVMDKTGHHNLVDMCSGGGGAIMMVRKGLKANGHSAGFRALLTDLYPNMKAWEYLKTKSGGEIEYLPQSADARTGVQAGPGFYTIFNGFHHFRPHEAQAVLQQAVDRKMPFGVFEPIDRSLWQLVANVVSILVPIWFVAPFVRPFRWRRLFFTYLIPLIPLCTMWDGIASVLRLYDPKMIQELLEKVDSKAYVWEMGKASHRFGKVIYLIGYPRETGMAARAADVR